MIDLYGRKKLLKILFCTNFCHIDPVKVMLGFNRGVTIKLFSGYLHSYLR